MDRKPSILIIVENLTVPLDRRVWQEATTLVEAGYAVSVICPVGGPYCAAYEFLDGVHIFRHPLPLEGRGPVGYALEYGWALLWELALSIKVQARVGFDVMQACNPPDTMFLLGALWKAFFGVPFVFDHHDINPELYEAKFGCRGFFHKLLLTLERWTFKSADVVISANEAFKRIAIERGGMARDRVFVTRSIPDMARFKRVAPVSGLKKGRKHLVGYVGIMGAQDGVDLLVEAMSELVNAHGRRDIQCMIVGSGTELAALQNLAKVRHVEDYVTFTGFLAGKPLLEAFSTFDIGVIPDRKNAYNDKISMNKVFEYMSLGIPFVQFDLDEGRATAGDAALYALDNSAASLAVRITELADDDALRARQVATGLSRAGRMLRWDIEKAELLAAYELAFAMTLVGRPATSAPVTSA